MIGQHTATKDHTIAADKTIGADGDGLTVLAVVLQINGMAEQLGVIAGDGGEGTDGNSVGAVNVVVLGDGGMITQQEFAATVGLVGEVERIGAAGETRDPVAPADGSHFAKLQQI